MGPLPDQIPLKLSQSAKDVKDQLATAGGGVDLLLQGPEANAARLQVPDGADKMRQGAAEPIQPPNDQGVPGTQVGERLGEAGAFRHGAGHSVGVQLLAAGCRQGVLLEGKGLIKGRDPGVANEHRSNQKSANWPLFFCSKRL